MLGRNVYAVLVEPLEEGQQVRAGLVALLGDALLVVRDAQRRLCVGRLVRRRRAARTPSTREGSNRGRGAGPTRTNKSHGAMLRTAVPTFASSWARSWVVRTGCCAGGTRALAAAKSKQAVARRIAGELWQYLSL